MTKVQDYSEFLMLVDDVKKNYSPVITNCYLLESDIKRLIFQNRLFYIRMEGGLWFIEDNIYYRNIFYYWSHYYKPIIKLDNALYVVPRVFYGGETDGRYLTINDYFMKLGFSRKNTLRQTIDDVDFEYNSLQEIMELATELLDNAGFAIEVANEGNVEEIRKLLISDTMLPVYQTPYMTDEEYKVCGDKGGIHCIRNSEGIVVAAGGIPLDKPYSGFVTIADKYKVMFGIAPMLSYKICEYCKRIGYHKISNWIDLDNKESIEYHENIGVKWGNRYLEYLVREE